MGKETLAKQAAREANFPLARASLEACMEGQVENHGYHLWVHASIFTENGGHWNQLGITRRKARSFLVRDLSSWIQGLREGTRGKGVGEFDLSILGAYFLGAKAPHRIPYKTLGTTPKEFQGFLRAFNPQP